MRACSSTRVRDLLDEALARPASERRAFLDHVCAGDSALHAEAQDLLEALDQAGSFLERPAMNVGSPSRGLADGCMIGRQIGRYTIQREIAAGGMGAVYEAIQDQPRRVVALKIMRQGIASPWALRRFEFESHILGRLRHPGIAQVYEAGMHSNDAGAAVPYFVMEYIPNAASLTEYAARNGLTSPQRMELFTRVCDAVHHGHQRGVIHRDLKPPNILVDSNGDPKIIDFGVARATDSDVALTTLRTDVGQLIGTLQYMSPEQCLADPHDLDIRSDVYSLGVVLYELLAGRLPYDLSRLPVHEAALVIREHSPAPVSTFDRTLRGDVETIVLKTLEKDRSRRYGSAAALAEDIRRYLSNEPISARPASMIYHLRAFTRRNRAIVAALSALIVVLAATSATISVLWIKAERARGQTGMLARNVTLMFGEQLRGAVDIADRAGNEAIARDLIAQAERALQARFDEQPEVLIESLFALGSSYEIIGDFENAEARYQRALEISSSSLGAAHALTGLAHMRLANVSRNRTDHDRAENWYLKAIDALASDRGFRITALSDLADMYHDLGRCAEAERLVIEARHLRASIPGFQPHDGAYLMTQLAGIYRSQERFDQADDLLAEALDVASSGSDEHHVLREAARLRLAQGRWEEARRMQERALELSERQLGPDAIETLACVELEALIDLDQGHWDRALQGFGAAADRGNRSLRTEHKWWAAHFSTGQAQALIKLRRYSEAEAILHEAYQQLHARLSDAHHRTQNCIRVLAELYNATGRAELDSAYRAKLRPDRCL